MPESVPEIPTLMRAGSSDDAIELTGGSSPPEGHQEFSLPRADGGKDAWLFLAACVMIESLVWGFPFAYGVFQEYYSSHEPFMGSNNIPVIGTCAMGIMYLGAPVVFGLLQSYPQWRRPAAAIGLVIMCLAISLSSFSTNVNHLIVSQGIIYALGGGLTYAPTILWLDEWFIKRKGLAFGVMWSGTGLAGFVLPLTIQWLLDRFGYQTTLRTWAICLFVLTGPLLFFLKPRIPISNATQSKRFDLSFLKTPAFVIMQLANIIESLGYFLPTIYLPTYAKTLGAGNITSTIPIILVNVASVFGCIAMGAFIDRLHVTTCITISTIGTTLGVFLLWGFATSLPPLLIFSVIYGFFAGSYTSAWPGIMKLVQAQKATAAPSMVFACLAAGRGIGNVVAGPLSEALIKGASLKGHAHSAYGTDYGSLIIFTGVTALLGGAGLLGRRVGLV